ncbi:J domain-containing protein [Tautonia rosea]|uniref:J domain-containing protein n=1 Tax=Tautonia rosea TaxID=2728037 RepID=UPI001473256C|nr:J domain-containing protein [Tautonia rosea]
MLLMAIEQDDRIIWVVVEQHRPKGRIRSRIVLHLGQYRDRDEAEAAFLDRLQTSPMLHAVAERWAANAEDVLTDRKARARFLLHGVSTGGIAEYADDFLLKREQQERQARERARAASWPAGIPSVAFATLGLPTAASLAEIKAAYRRRAFLLHPDRGGDHAAMVALNAAYEDAAWYAEWRG